MMWQTPVLNDSTGGYISIKELHKRFGEGPPVLDNINFSLARDDFAAVIGPSGCGKSTLLKLVSGLVKPTGGTVTFAASGASADSPSALKRAFVFQDANLLPWSTIVDNVALPLKLKALPERERRERAMRMLELVKLTHAAHQYPRELSGGMRMRVSIARALATEPELLLLDEPFGALDEMTRDDLNEELLDLRERQHWTAMFVTHSVSEAVFLASKVLVLSANPGRVHAVIPVPLPYPRRAAIRTSPLFQQLVAQITESLHSLRKPVTTVVS